MVSTEIRSSATTENNFVPEERKIIPVKLWAALGVAFTLTSVTLFTVWILSGPERTPPGPSTIPTWMRWSLDIQIAIGWVAAVGVVWFFLIKPWRRQRRLTTDGMLIIGFVIAYWQDTIVNSLQPWSLYNTRIQNWGSWNNFMPGWSTPHGERVAEPAIWAVPTYIWGLFGVTVFASFMMRKFKQRWPQVTNLQLVLMLFAFMVIVDLVVEVLWIRSGIYVYNGVPTPKWLTLFDGKWYQFPLSEPIILGATMTGWGCLRYFRDDKGNTIVERGIEEMKCSTKAKQRYRLFALTAGVHLVVLFGYSFPMAFLGLHIRDWPDDIVQRSYFTNTLCGPGTDYACPSQHLPIPHRKSAAVRSDGTLFVPDGMDIQKVTK